MLRFLSTSKRGRITARFPLRGIPSVGHRASAAAMPMPRMTTFPLRRLSSPSTSAAAPSMFDNLKSIPSTYPIMFGAFFTGTKTCGADIFVQTYVEGKALEDVDYKRTSTFMVFGFFYMGIAQYYFYVKFMGQRLYPNAGVYAAKSLREKAKDPKGTFELFSQVGLDQMLHIPFVFYPCYYMTKALIMENPAGHEEDSVVELAWHKYTTNFKMDVLTAWKIWIPCNLVNFGFMPMHYRVPFMAVCSFGFCIVLSTMRGGAPAKVSEECEEASKVFKAQLAHHGDDSAAIITAIQEALTAVHMDSEHGHTLDFEGFKGLINRLVQEPMEDSILRSIFQVCDRDQSGRISGAELTTLLFAFHGSDSLTSAERCGFIFDAIDLDGSGQLTFGEMKTMLTGLLAMREVLLVNGGDVSASDAMDALASGAGSSRERAVPATAAARARVKADRLTDLKWRYKTTFMNKPDVTLKDILDFEAGKIAQKILAEADVIVSDNHVSRKEFQEWIGKKSKSSRELVKLFEAFTPLLRS